MQCRFCSVQFLIWKIAPACNGKTASHTFIHTGNNLLSFALTPLLCYIEQSMEIGFMFCWVKEVTRVRKTLLPYFLIKKSSIETFSPAKHTHAHRSTRHSIIYIESWLDSCALFIQFPTRHMEIWNTQQLLMKRKDHIYALLQTHRPTTTQEKTTQNIAIWGRLSLSRSVSLYR